MTYDPNETTVLPQTGTPSYPVTEELPAVGPVGSGPDRFFLKILAGLLVLALAATATILIINSQRTDQVAASEDTPATAVPTVAGEAAPPTPAQLEDEPPGYWQVVNVPDGLNVRAGPGTDNDIVGALRVGDRHVFSTGERATINGADWRQIQLNDGQTGWVSSRFLAPDVAPDEDAPPATAVPTGGGRTTIVCFQDQGQPNRVAELQFTNGTQIDGFVRVTNGESARDTTATGTLNNGEAAMTLTDTRNGKTETANWLFGPASVDVGDGTSLRVVDCGAIADQLS